MTSARFASLAVCSTLPERQANSSADASSPSAGAFSSAAAFVDQWIGRPAPAQITVQRREYGSQYNGVGECPF